MPPPPPSVVQVSPQCFWRVTTIVVLWPSLPRGRPRQCRCRWYPFAGLCIMLMWSRCAPSASVLRSAREAALGTLIKGSGKMASGHAMDWKCAPLYPKGVPAVVVPLDQ